MDAFSHREDMATETPNESATRWFKRPPYSSEKELEELGIKLVPGHYPEHDSIEDKEMFIKMMKTITNKGKNQR